jgi:hypothetical protein
MNNNMMFNPNNFNNNNMMGNNNMMMNNNMMNNNMMGNNNMMMNNNMMNNNMMKNNMMMNNNMMNNNMMNNNMMVNNIMMMNNTMNNHMMNNNMMNNNMMNNMIDMNKVNNMKNMMNMNQNVNMNNMMLKMHNAQNMMMMNAIMKNQQTINLMKKQLAEQQLKNKMNQILNNTNNNSNNYDFFEDQEEVDYEQNEALSLVAREQELQRQNFENLQPPTNIDYNEVTPEFMHTFISDKTLFSGSGHNLEGKWAHGESRGGRPYNPPDGWIGFGLNVLNKYDNGNNDWLACDGRPGEWCIAFHGACVRNTSDQIKQIIKPILEQNLKPGGGQAYSSYDDANHPGQKVGVGVYCSPNPSVIEGYAGIIEVNGYRYKVAFMLRVKPDKIRYSSSQPDYWVLNAGNGDFSEMRPYRFLIKKT